MYSNSLLQKNVQMDWKDSNKKMKVLTTNLDYYRTYLKPQLSNVNPHHLYPEIQFCQFCKANPKRQDYFHTMKNENGLVVCPVLRKVVCRICKATGSIAHTTKFCPTK
ncbi:Nanos-like protein 1 [Armadillidium vulgare]|nr:Nanos-like protein 1 [Armadillidium vulgare]